MKPPRPHTTSQPRLYHLTPVPNVEAILRTGLKADDHGAIYAFTDLIVADTIACNQVFTDRYALFAIMAVTGDVLPDDVAEFSSPYQRMIMQSRIDPEHLRCIGTFDAVYDRPTAWDYMLGEKLYGYSPEQVDAEFAFRREMDARVTSEMAARKTEAMHRRKS